MPNSEQLGSMPICLHSTDIHNTIYIYYKYAFNNLGNKSMNGYTYN